LKRHCQTETLTSSVPGKHYFGFRQAEPSRAINADLFVSTEDEFAGLLGAFHRGFVGLGATEIARAVYTMAFSVFAAHDVTRIGRKASATFFEVLVGHLVAKALQISPRKNVVIPESGGRLSTDFVFDPGPRSRKLHLPIKTSTRERAVQAWVHQLVLNRIFGDDNYRGILVVAAETKRNSRTGSVVEICVPKQLQMFQSRLSRMERLYYLDPPEKYLALCNTHPRIDVKSFATFFSEAKSLMAH